MFARLIEQPSRSRFRRPWFVTLLVACTVPALLPAYGLWTGPDQVRWHCDKTSYVDWPPDSVFRALLGSLTRQRIVPYLVDSRTRHFVVAGPQAPAFAGSTALRRSRAYLAVWVDSVRTTEGKVGYTISEGASMRPPMTKADSLSLQRQASRYSFELARGAHLSGGACWIHPF
jgi:hypothetical protein